MGDATGMGWGRSGVENGQKSSWETQDQTSVLIMTFMNVAKYRVRGGPRIKKDRESGVTQLQLPPL